MKKITRTVCKTHYEIGFYNTEKREVKTHTVDSFRSLKEVEQISRKKLSNLPGYSFVYCKAVGNTDVVYEMNLEDFINYATISTKNKKAMD